MVTIKCLKCGHLFTKAFWIGRANCPSCGAKETAPVLTAPVLSPSATEQASQGPPGQNFCNVCRKWSTGSYCPDCGRKLV